MIIDFRTENSQLILNSLVDDDDYNERICDLRLHGWAVKKSPHNIIPGIWDHSCPYSPYESLLSVAEKMTKISNLVSESINEPPLKYAWWFSMFSDETGFSIDFIYPSPKLNPQYKGDKNGFKLVYGIDYDLGDIYINSHDEEMGDGWLAYVLLETSVKHWCMKQNI